MLREQARMSAACRHGAWLASQAMKCVTSFLNRLLAMAMEDQESHLQVRLLSGQTRNTMLIVSFPQPIAVLCSTSGAGDMLACTCSQLQAE